MNTKKYGNIGESNAIFLFTKYGIPVYIPFGDNEKSDLIVEIDGRFLKIQVKTSVKAEDGKMIFDLTSSTCHRKNGVKHKYSCEEVDFFFCYNVERNKSFLIKNNGSYTAIIIRYEKPKNHQTKNINYEKDYEFDNVIKTLINKENLL